MMMSFPEISEESVKTAGFKHLQLLLQAFHIGGEIQPRAVVEHQMISGVDALKIEPLIELRAQRCKFRPIDGWHDEESRAGVESMTGLHKLIAAPART